MAFDEQGQADTVERKVEICERAYRILTETGGFPARGHHLRPQHLRHRHRDRGAQRLRRGLHRGHPRDQGETAAHPGQRRGEQRLVLLPRQRSGARGDSLGLPVPRHPGRDGHGHRQRRPAGHLRRHPQGPAGAGRGRGPEPAGRRHRAAAGDRREVQGVRRQASGDGGLGLAGAAGRGAALPRPGGGHRRLHRGGHRRGPAARRPAHRGDRRPADGRHEHRGRPVRRGQDVSPPGGQERPGHEEGGGPPGAVHRGREGRQADSRPKGKVVHGHGEGRRARHRQEHRGRGAPV